MSFIPIGLANVSSFFDSFTSLIVGRVGSWSFLNFLTLNSLLLSSDLLLSGSLLDDIDVDFWLNKDRWFRGLLLIESTITYFGATGATFFGAGGAKEAWVIRFW
jgi:hypothetical protein